MVHKTKEEFIEEIKLLQERIAELEGLECERKKVDESLREKIEKAKRLMELGALVADVAHEVNHPLMVILGRAQLSMTEGEENGAINRSMRIIAEQCHRAKDIIQRLLMFSRPATGKVERVDINKSMKEVVAIMEHQFQLQNILIKRNYGEALPPALVDEKQMQEVFMNLLNNARDAISGEGEIEIATSREKDFLRVDIRDTGCGISEEDLEKIFRPFFTTKEKGTGLGLPVCRTIVMAHGGEIIHKSKKGEGTTATVFLPIEK